MTLTLEILLKLGLAILLGGLIGAEREFRDKTAGFRTMILISTGSALFTIFSSALAVNSDPNRIAANIVTGIGFLGAGAILRDGSRITGLTTASAIWLTAAIGMGVGGGYYLLSSVATLTIIIVLWFFPNIEAWIDNLRHSRTYHITCALDLETYTRLDALFQECGLRTHSRKRVKSNGSMICTWHAAGKPQGHERLIEKMLIDDAVTDMHF